MARRYEFTSKGLIEYSTGPALSSSIDFGGSSISESVLVVSGTLVSGSFVAVTGSASGYTVVGITAPGVVLLPLTPSNGTRVTTIIIGGDDRGPVWVSGSGETVYYGSSTGSYREISGIGASTEAIYISQFGWFAF